MYHWDAIGSVEYFDTFKDPMDVMNAIEEDIEIIGGTPYNYGHKWENVTAISQGNRIVRRPE